MDFLKEDLQHLFDDQGIDKSQYDDVVEFRDPITQYNNASGKTLLCDLYSRQYSTFTPHAQAHMKQIATVQAICSTSAC